MAFKNNQKFHLPIVHRPPFHGDQGLVLLECRLVCKHSKLDPIVRKYNIDLATEKMDFATGSSHTLTQTWIIHTMGMILSILEVASIFATSVFIESINDSRKIRRYNIVRSKNRLQDGRTFMMWQSNVLS